MPRKTRLVTGARIYPIAAIEKFCSEIAIVPSGCWVYKCKSEYGLFVWEGKGVVAHRFMYDLIKGSIPQDLVLDHLCCVTRCVNPDHLEPVTSKENIVRAYQRKRQRELDAPITADYIETWATELGVRAALEDYVVNRIKGVANV